MREASFVALASGSTRTVVTSARFVESSSFCNENPSPSSSFFPSFSIIHHNLTTPDDRPQSSHSFAKVSLPVASRLILFSSHIAAGSAFFAHTSSLRAAPRVTALHISDQIRTYASKKKKMPPKKEVKQEKVLLGRPGNSLKSGIVCTATLCVLCACDLDIPLT